MPESLFYKKLKGRAVQCRVCHHFCTIPNGSRGICCVRENQDGTLKTLIYDRLLSENIDPIEKKPLFHFLPGSKTYSIATAGCNFRCLNCQNAGISQLPRNNHIIPGQKRTPQEIVTAARKADCQSIAYTYTEPTIFIELALKTMKLARKAGLKNIWVSNGYMSDQSRQAILPCLDAINIDLKSIRQDFYTKIIGAKLEPVLNNIRAFHQSDTWLELTTLLITGHNDSDTELRNLARFIKTELSPEIPWHISRFFPTHKLTDTPATPLSRIKTALKIARDEGLEYIYSGNTLDLNENTVCPTCETTIFERGRKPAAAQCPNCEHEIPIILK